MEILKTPLMFSTLQRSNFWRVHRVSAIQDNDALWEMDAVVLWLLELAF